MAFVVTGSGIALRKHFDFGPKKFASAGDVYEPAALASELAGKVNLGGMSDEFKTALNVMATQIVNGLLAPTFMWHVQNNAKIMASYWKSGVLGGILRQPEFSHGDLQLEQGETSVWLKHFGEVLKDMKINRWGYLRAIAEVMTAYETHCAGFGTKQNAVLLRIMIEEN